MLGYKGLHRPLRSNPFTTKLKWVLSNWFLKIQEKLGGFYKILNFLQRVYDMVICPPKNIHLKINILIEIMAFKKLGPIERRLGQL